MKRLLLFVVLLVACKKKGGNPEWEWKGIPENAKPFCAWDESTYNETAGTCIAEGVSYSCVMDKYRRRVECGRTSPPMTPEAM